MSLSTPAQRHQALAAVCLSALMLGLEISSVPPALSAIEQALGASFRQLQWVMAAYTIASTTILMAVGTLADRYGHKRVFATAITAFGITSLVCGLAGSAELLIAARFLQGLAGAAMLICQISVLSHQFPGGAERGRAFAWWGMVFGSGLGLGPVVGTAIMAIGGWPWVFLVHAALAVLTLVLAHRGVQESPAQRAGRLDVAGIATLSLAVFCLVLFVTQAPVLGFGSTEALGIAALSLLGFAGFVWAERVSCQPMVDFSVFRVRNFSGALLGSMGMNFSFWPFIIYLPIYFHTGLGLSRVQTGLALLAYTLPTLFVPPLAERLALRWQSGRVVPLGMATIGLGFVLMALGSLLTAPLWLLLPGCVVAGIGLGLTNTTTTNAITAALPVSKAGMASGMDCSARMISLAFNIAVMGLVLVQGVMAALPPVPAVPARQGTGSLRLLAEQLAAGDLNALTPLGLSAEEALAALASGFAWVMAYGAASVLLLGLLSWRIFASTAGRQRCLDRAVGATTSS
ncbi:MAG: MFS transporter [Acidovorax sp.]|nr:MFS transporter [Acidovorax sp.]